MESIDYAHVNGQQFETRQFKCGRKIVWVPNYSRMEMRAGCPLSPDETMMTKKSKDLIRALVGVAESATWLSEAQVSQLIDSIERDVRAVVRIGAL